MLNCGHCGQLLENYPDICPHCGTKVLYQTDEKERLEQFYQRVASKRTKNLTGWLFAVCLISATVDLIISILGLTYLGVAECIFFVIFAILLLKKKTYVIPLVLTIYNAACLILNVIDNGRPTGIVGIIIGILLTIRLKGIKDAYDVFTKTGSYPNEQI